MNCPIINKNKRWSEFSYRLLSHAFGKQFKSFNVEYLQLKDIKELMEEYSVMEAVNKEQISPIVIKALVKKLREHLMAIHVFD